MKFIQIDNTLINVDNIVSIDKYNDYDNCFIKVEYNLYSGFSGSIDTKTRSWKLSDNKCNEVFSKLQTYLTNK